MNNKSKVFLIHGFDGEPNGGWRPYLMEELAKLDIYACALSMPTPAEPILEEWLDEIKRVIERNPDDNIYLVGHSLGGTAILRYIEKFPSTNIRGAVLVSSPCHKNSNDYIKTFLSADFDWEKIKTNLDKVTVIHGDNDEQVPVSDASEIAEKLDGKIVIIKNGKHLNGSAGFTKLPEALEAIKEMVSQG